MKYTEDGVTVSETDLTGSISDFPLEIVCKMAINSGLQGNDPEKIFEIFAYSPTAGLSKGGFVWSDSPEGHNFWNQIISERNFKNYFKKYPKCKGTYIIEESDNFSWIKPEMPDELIQLVIRENIIQRRRDQLKTLHIASCFSWTDSQQGWDFWSKIDKGDYSAFTSSIKTNKNETQLQRKESNFVRGTVPEGCILCGKKGKSSIAIGPLSFRKCIGQ